MGSGVGLGAPTLLAVENPCITYSWTSIHVVPPYLWFHHICGSTFTDSTYHGLFSTTVFTVEKNLHISEPTQVKLIVQGSTVLSFLFCPYLALVSR